MAAVTSGTSPGRPVFLFWCREGEGSGRGMRMARDMGAVPVHVWPQWSCRSLANAMGSSPPSASALLALMAYGAGVSGCHEAAQREQQRHGGAVLSHGQYRAAAALRQ